jgi:hypothetical protein
MHLHYLCFVQILCSCLIQCLIFVTRCISTYIRVMCNWVATVGLGYFTVKAFNLIFYVLTPAQAV